MGSESWESWEEPPAERRRGGGGPPQLVMDANPLGATESGSEGETSRGSESELVRGMEPARQRRPADWAHHEAWPAADCPRCGEPRLVVARSGRAVAAIALAGAVLLLPLLLFACPRLYLRLKCPNPLCSYSRPISSYPTNLNTA